MTTDFTVQKASRSYQYIHFYVPEENTVEGIRRYITSLKYKDCVKILSALEFPWYQPSFPSWDLITGDIFNVDYYRQSTDNGISELIHDLVSARKNSQISMTTKWNSEEIEGFLSSTEEFMDVGMDFTFDKKNRIDSIRIIGIDPETMTSDTFFGFKAKEIRKNFFVGENELEFLGFKTVSEAIETGLLAVDQSDTISINGNFLGTGKDPISSNFEKATLSTSIMPAQNLITNQTLLYHLDHPTNRFLIREGFHAGQIILDVLLEGEVKDIYIDDSLSQKMSKDELLQMLEVYPYEEYMTEPWDSDFEYYEGDIVEFEGLTYYALTDENRGKEPSKAPDIWVLEDNFVEMFDGSAITILILVREMVYDFDGKLLAWKPRGVGIMIGAEYTPEGIDKPICFISFSDFERISIEDGRAQLNEVPYSDLIIQGKLSGIILKNSAIKYYK